jgi:plasmid stabilization system protein ParE
MTMKLLISPLAASDIEEIGYYIAQDNPARAHCTTRTKSESFMTAWIWLGI